MMDQKTIGQDKIKNATPASGRYSMHTMSFCVRLASREEKSIRDRLVAYCKAERLRYYEEKNERANTKEMIFPGFLLMD